MSAIAPFRPHPVVAAPSDAQVSAMIHDFGPEKAGKMLVELEKQRLDLIERMDPAHPRADLYNCGHVPAHWRKAQALLEQSLLLCLFGGNGAGKTWFAIWYAINLMMQKPGSKVLVLHEEEKPSIDTHQTYAYLYLPLQLRPTDTYKLKRSVTTKVGYTVGNGFADNVLVFPNRSMMRFGFYKQDIGGYEGGGWTLVVADENLPLKWLNTLLFRLPRAGGRFLWCFSPVEGITPAINSVIKGAKTLESRRAPLLSETHRVNDDQDWPEGHMPSVQQCVNPDHRVMYFFSEDNPFGGYATHKKLLAGADSQKIERRAYGFARNLLKATFPKFGPHNILPHASMPARDVTRYHVLDPAGARNCFQIWLAVDSLGRHFIYREWPDVENFGEWAVQSENVHKINGDPGPAQPTLGYGIADYKLNAMELEGWKWDGKAYVPRDPQVTPEEIFRRLIDPRAGAAQSIAEQDGSTSLIDRFAEEQRDAQGNLIGPGMDFEPASGQQEEQGIIAINNLLAYDSAQPIVSLLNEPRLYISERCKNVIYALSNYVKRAGIGTKDEACKDPVDVVRYAATEELEHVPAGSLSGFAGKGGYG